MLMVVDLPAPFGPRNPKVSPACTSKSTPARRPRGRRSASPVPRPDRRGPPVPYRHPRLLNSLAIPTIDHPHRMSRTTTWGRGGQSTTDVVAGVFVLARELRRRDRRAHGHRAVGRRRRLPAALPGRDRGRLQDGAGVPAGHQRPPRPRRQRRRRRPRHPGDGGHGRAPPRSRRSPPPRSRAHRGRRAGVRVGWSSCGRRWRPGCWPASSPPSAASWPTCSTESSPPPPPPPPTARLPPPDLGSGAPPGPQPPRPDPACSARGSGAAPARRSPGPGPEGRSRSRTIPATEPLTSHHPPHPWTPIPFQRFAERRTLRMDGRGMVARKAPPHLDVHVRPVDLHAREGRADADDAQQRPPEAVPERKSLRRKGPRRQFPHRRRRAIGHSGATGRPQRPEWRDARTAAGPGPHAGDGRALMAPSSILLAGAGTAAAILAGVPLGRRRWWGAAAWAGKVAWACPAGSAGPT